MKEQLFKYSIPKEKELNINTVYWETCNMFGGLFLTVIFGIPGDCRRDGWGCDMAVSYVFWEKKMGLNRNSINNTQVFLLKYSILELLHDVLYIPY